MSAVLQLAGALAVLAAFTAVQLGVTLPNSYPSLLLNPAGAAVLAALAWHERLWGFLLLEGVWALVSAWGLYRAARNSSHAARSRSTAAGSVS